jgi:hypothetical protein
MPHRCAPNHWNAQRLKDALADDAHRSAARRLAFRELSQHNASDSLEFTGLPQVN